MTPLLAQASPEEVRRAVEEVLGRPEYRQTAAGDSLLDRLVDALVEQLGRLLLRLAGQGGDGSWVGSVVLAVLVVAIVVVAWRTLSRFRRGHTVDPIVDGPTGRSARDWGSEAASHAAAGRHRDALRCRYRETVALLARAGLLEEVPGRTTGEYAAALADALPAGRTAFDRLTRLFEAAWYGRRDVTAEDVQDGLDAQAAVVAAGSLPSPVGGGGSG
ncbi:DUF4129 domain-containing protein [Euzebya rosea]|uniref:DUF4129 domain-containing protein n=1 Tax=Euzebya rosea TaxID=2052804 RepID=UPI001300A600|nr:DUF4129 domain-containing protein [Euzebya rosea]